MPLATLLDESGFWSAEDMNDSYGEAASFTGFLLDRYGVDAYKALYRFRDVGTDTLEAVIEKMSGEKIPQLEIAWKDWLLRFDVPTIEPGIAVRATEIFRMEDPSGDDTGDGSYVYPLGPSYRPGMFDLTGFSVLSDEKKLYFELSYRELAEGSDSTGWGFEGTFTRIAVDRGGSGEEGAFSQSFNWSANATLAGHWDALIDIGDCGVEMVESGRIAASLKRAPAGRGIGYAAQNRICFSIPCSEPETVRRRWRYAVLVGGCAECGKHFRDWVGEFLPVGEHASEQTGGGGSADGSGPNVYDVLLPAGQDQAKLLAARPVVLPMVGD
jgi:carbohydrate-binding DOMON domain-containing protein